MDRTYEKVFVIGFGKTGTTTMEASLRSFGFSLGEQAVAEILLEDAARGRMDRIVAYCHTADAFQDVPFMYPGFFRTLDRAFPRSKFILTVRDSPDQWFRSLVRFHTALFSRDKSAPPDEHDLAEAGYRYKGWLLDVKKLLWNYPEISLYDRDTYTKKYLEHNAAVIAHFEHRHEDLLVVNGAGAGEFARLCAFQDVRTDLREFPWANRTDTLVSRLGLSDDSVARSAAVHGGT